jgi:hypothetical protein
MGMFWPDHIDPAPGILGRLGRFLHWVAMVIAAIIVVGGIAIIIISNSPGPEWLFGGGALILGIALVVYFAGRGLRYLFAGE